MKSTCPHCAKTHEIPDQYRDQKIKCPSCATGFVATEDKDIINQAAEKLYPKTRPDGSLPGEPRDWSAWYIVGLLAPVFFGFGSEGSAIGVISGFGLLLFCIAVGNILVELRIIAHYHRNPRP